MDAKQTPNMKQSGGNLNVTVHEKLPESLEEWVLITAYFLFTLVSVLVFLFQ